MNNNNIVDVFLNPKTVAVIGASKNMLKGGYRILSNLVLNNFNGKIFPVNPNATGKIHGLEFKKSVLDIEEEIDIAIFYVPNHLIPELLEECVKKGIKGAIIETSGFEEVGEKGRDLSDQILDISSAFSKIRIVGPNCMGLTRIDTDSKKENKGGFFTSFLVFNEYKRGNIAVISQSGMLNGGYFTHVVTKYPNLGFRYICSIGNKMDLSEIEFLDYFLNDNDISVIAMYLESFKDPRKFINLCKKAKKLPNKTIILVKGGLTSQGQNSSLSHTAALSEDFKLTEGVIKQSGIIQARNFFELFEFARTFSMLYNSKKILPKRGGVAQVFGSGGAGTISADLTMQYGLKLPILGEKAYSALVELFPSWMPPNKFAFVDIWPAMEKAMTNSKNPRDVIRSVYNILLEEPEIEGIFNMIFCSRQFRAVNDVDNLIDIISNYPKPVFLYLVGEFEEVRKISYQLGKNNIPSFSNLEDMVKNFQILIQESKYKNN
ncbi:MAG: CoA-binding protein [Candidatus Odinarchaeota archaeon]